MLINFQSLRKKGKLLEAIIFDSDPDIIIGSETWLDSSIASSEILPNDLGYDIQRRDRPHDPHGGVLIAAKRGLQLGNIYCSQDIELISGTVTMEGNKTITIISYYRPPNRTDEAYVNKSREEFDSLLGKKRKNIFLTGGDFNLPDVNWDTLKVEGTQYPAKVTQVFFDMVSDNSLEQMVDFPTRKEKTLDLLFTSHPSYIEKCKPLPSIGNSDHDIVLLDTNYVSRPPKPPKRKIYLWKSADIQGIQEDLDDYSMIFEETSFDTIDTMWMSFKTKIHSIMEERVPSKISQSRYTHPWMNRKIRRLIRRKQRAHTRSRRTGKKRDKDRYKRLQSEVQLQIRRSHRGYMQEVVSESYKGNNKKFWSYIKSARQESTGVSPLKNEDGFLKSDSTSKANILNRQFESVFTKEDTSTMPDKGPSPYPDMPKLEVHWKGVHKLLKGLKTFKTTGPDSIPAFILKATADQLAPILTRLYQTSLDCGEVPTEWKDAWIVPVFKKGDKHKPANYRPVSLTSITCKLLEHIIHSNVMAHFDRHSILKDNQYGFRKKRSCETQLIVTIQEIASRLSKGDQVDVILLDFEKAFDKVSHSRLLYKMDYYGVRGTTLSWIQAFLSNRKQEVVLEGSHSDRADVLSGVPQGTVLGPLLFLAYINDLPDSLKSSDARLFADDSLLYLTVNGAKENEQLQEDLSALEEWERVWQMSFNPSKCSVIRITPDKKKSKKVFQSTYNLHNQVLEVTDASNYLGVKVTVDLTWSSHITEVAGKANRSWFFAAKFQGMYKGSKNSHLHHNGQTSARLRLYSLGSTSTRRHKDSGTSTTSSRQICVQRLHYAYTWLCHRHDGRPRFGKPPRSALHCQTESPVQDAAWIGRR